MSHDYYTCMHYDCAACLARETDHAARTVAPAPPVSVDVVARRSWREAFAWACCIAFVGGMVAVHILVSW